VGARVYVLQENATGNGNRSISLLNSTTRNPADSVGNYVLTDEHGGFSIAGDYTCVAGRQVYLYVRGGNSGGTGVNPSIGLMAALGACPERGNFTRAVPFVFVNEVTTVAAAYAMADVATDPTHVSRHDASLTGTGRTDAADLVRVSTGLANVALPANPRAKVPQSKINTLANILSACINTTGPGSSGCATLFANAHRSDSGKTAPEDTAAAAINIAQNPRAHIAALFGLQPRLDAPFQPYLASAPDDFVISVNNQPPGNVVASLSSHF
jgi:hypothetical protein